MRAITTDASYIYSSPGCQDPDTRPLELVTYGGSRVGVCAHALLTRTSRIPPGGVSASIRRDTRGDISDIGKDLAVADELVSGDDPGDRVIGKR